VVRAPLTPPPPLLQRWAALSALRNQQCVAIAAACVRQRVSHCFSQTPQQHNWTHVIGHGMRPRIATLVNKNVICRAQLVSHPQACQRDTVEVCQYVVDAQHAQAARLA
jgi:hypothetical protein